MSEFRKRVVDPAMIPLAAMLFIGVLVFSVSRILLAVPELGSNAIALLLSAEILGVGGVLAATTRLKPVQKAVLFLTGIALIGGGAAGASYGVRAIEAHAESVEVVAKDIAFERSSIELPADQPSKIEFTNRDGGIPHNVAIYRDDSFTESLFSGEIFNGVATRTYEVPPLAAGTYAFRCDVHPQQMTGEVTAGEGGAAGGGGEPTPADEAELVAANTSFDLSELLMTAGGSVTVSVENEDAGIPHNFAVYTDETASREIFSGEIFTGVATREYTFDAPEPGEYFFRCDVHPTQMTGTITFR